MKLVALSGLVVLLGLIGAGLAGITITVFLHRGATHRAIRMSRPLYEMGRWMTYLTVYMRHWEWRRIHRKHHAYTDIWIDELRHDPHSPVVISQREGIDGFRRVAWHMAAIYHAEAQCPDIRDSTYDLASDRGLDRLDRRVFDRPVIGAVVTGVVYAALFAAFAPEVLNLPRTPARELLCAVAGAARARSTHRRRAALRRCHQLRLPSGLDCCRRCRLRGQCPLALGLDFRRRRTLNPSPPS